MTLVINQSSSRKNFDNGLRDFLDIGELRGGGGGQKIRLLNFAQGSAGKRCFRDLCVSGGHAVIPLLFVGSTSMLTGEN